MTIHIFDYAGLPDQALKDAVAQAGDALSPVDIGIGWRVCHAPSLRGDCKLPHDSADLIVRVVRGSHPADKPVFGESVRPNDPKAPGVYITIFLGRVADASRRFQTPAPLLLGCAIAHEVGEMLGLTHSSDGIMRAAFDKEDMERALQGRLRFTAAQASALREALSNRLAQSRNLAAAVTITR